MTRSGRSPSSGEPHARSITTTATNTTDNAAIHRHTGLSQIVHHSDSTAGSSSHGHGRYGARISKGCEDGPTCNNTAAATANTQVRATPARTRKPTHLTGPCQARV